MDGNVFMNRDSSENLKRGYNESIGYTGVAEQVAGVAGSIFHSAATGSVMAEAAVRKFGPKGNEGIAKPLFKSSVNGLSSLAGWKKPFPEMEKDGIDGSSKDGGDSKTNTTENGHNNDVHKNSFESKSEGSVPKTDKSSKAYDVGGKATSISEEIDQATTSNRRDNLYCNLEYCMYSLRG
jgi:hypothetical protein